MTDLDVMRATFGTLAADTGFFVLALAFGLVVSILCSLKKAGWL